MNARVVINIYYQLYYLLNCIIYFLIIIFDKSYHKIFVENIDNTIDNMKKYSCIRFGDGEFEIISGRSIYFQDYSDELSQHLAYILDESNMKNGLLICIPQIFDKLNQWDYYSRYFWSKYRIKKYKIYQKLLSPSVIYGNAHATRPYMDSSKKQKLNIVKYYDNLKEIWDNKDIIIVEGFDTRNGVGNNLFDNAKSIKRIICPPNNAFSRYVQIYDACIKVCSDIVFLISLGPTGKILAYNLWKKGYYVLDIGHIDSDYEWFIHNVNNRNKLNNNKHQAEIIDNNNISPCEDPKYLNQIIIKII